MKKLIVLLAAIGIIIGCKAGDVVNNNGMLTAIELSAYNIGFYVGKSKTPDDDKAIADAYQLARTGTLSPEQVAEAFKQLKIDQPQYAGSVGIVLKNMGAGFDVEGNLISIDQIPVAYWDAAAAGYESGYAIGKVNQRSKVKAVK